MSPDSDLLFFRLRDLADEPILHLLARPGRFAQEREAGLDAGIVLETADGDAAPQPLPAMPLEKLVKDVFQRDAVQGDQGDVRRAMS